MSDDEDMQEEGMLSEGESESNKFENKKKQTNMNENTN